MIILFGSGLHYEMHHQNLVLAFTLPIMHIFIWLNSSNAHYFLHYRSLRNAPYKFVMQKKASLQIMHALQHRHN